MVNILLTSATEREISPALDWLRTCATRVGENGYTLGDVSVQICITGVGIMATTEALTRALLSLPFDFAVQAGVAGAYSRSLALGEVVFVETDALSDLGAEDSDGSFMDVYALGLAGKNDPPFCDGRLRSLGLEGIWGEALRRFPSVSAITVQTVAGKEETITARAIRYRADVETMEGAPFHYCCLRTGVPFAQLRAISNYVEPRNRAAWKMPQAIAALNATLIGAMELWSRAQPATS